MKNLALILTSTALISAIFHLASRKEAQLIAQVAAPNAIPVQPTLPTAPAVAIAATTQNVASKLPAVGKLTSETEAWLANEAASMGEVQSEPAAVARRIQTFAQSLNSEAVNFLGGVSLDESRPQDERFLAVYMLSFVESPDAYRILSNIATADARIYHAPSAGHHNSVSSKSQFEDVVRIQALKILEAKVLADPKLISEYHQTAGAVVPEHIQKLALASFNAVRNGKPLIGTILNPVTNN